MHITQKRFAIWLALATGIALATFAQTQAQEQNSTFLRVTPTDIKWNPMPAMPKGAQIAVLQGNPSKAGLFTIRIKLPANYKLPVHSHPDERVRTIISGTYYSAVGEKPEPTKLSPFPTGTVSYLTPKVWQFSETRDEEVVFQISGIGPTGINYLDPSDDPRQK